MFAGGIKPVLSTNHRLKSMLLPAAVVLLCAMSGPLFGQEKMPPLRVVRYSGDLTAFLAQIATTYKVNLGLEMDPRQPYARIEISVNDATFEDILNAVVQSAPRYQWRNENGIVDVFPKETTSPLLETVVHRFQFSGNDWGQAIDALTAAPEVQSQIANLGLVRREGKAAAAGKDASQFSIDLNDASVRRALHEITRESGKSFWVYRPWQAERSFSIGDSN